MWRHGRLVLLCLVLAMPGLFRNARAFTFVVGPSPSDPYHRIQDAIDIADSGDTVPVRSGTYVENLDLLGKSIVLHSESGPETTRIDGRNQDDSVIRIISGEDDRTTIEGFTITGGRGYANPKSGGGIIVLSSSCTIRGNVISGNEATGPTLPSERGNGGGIYCEGAGGGFVLVENNTFHGNSAGANGGAVAIRQKMRATIRNNLFIGNDCTLGDGGGIWALTTIGQIDIRDNVFLDNLAGDHGGGAYIASNHYETPLDFVLHGNIFADNTASSKSITNDAGGGCWIASMNGPITSNTFVRNLSVSDSPADGSGLAITQQSSVSIEFNILVWNRPGAGILCEDAVTSTVRHNLFWNNLPDHVLGGSCATQSLQDNLFANPQFCDSLGTNFSLASSSPALNDPAGPIGAATSPGCSGTALMPTTWSRIKSRLLH